MRLKGVQPWGPLQEVKWNAGKQKGEIKSKEDIIALDLLLTQCMPKDNATAFALILEAKISGSRRAGTGPAPREKDNT